MSNTTYLSGFNHARDVWDFVITTEYADCKVLATSYKGSHGFILYQLRDNPATIDTVVIRNHGHGEYGFSTYTEFCAPFYYDVPAKMMAQLPETDHEYAQSWRAKVASEREIKAKLRAFDGKGKEITINGTAYTYLGRNPYARGQHHVQDGNGERWRIDAKTYNRWAREQVGADN